LRPTGCQAATASVAPDQSSQRKVRAIPFTRRHDTNSSVEYALNPIEQLFADQRLEVAPPAVDAVIGHVEDADVQPVLEHHVKRLRADLQSAPRAQAQSRDLGENLFLGEATCPEVFERAADERCPLG